MIEEARACALQKINAELVELYWNLGKYISKRMENAEWGDLIVPKLAKYLHETRLDIKGFDKTALNRMRKFYDIWRGSEIGAALRHQISWTNHKQPF
jgi:hypothetical protein